MRLRTLLLPTGTLGRQPDLIQLLLLLTTLLLPHCQAQLRLTDVDPLLLDQFKSNFLRMMGLNEPPRIRRQQRTSVDALKEVFQHFDDADQSDRPSTAQPQVNSYLGVDTVRSFEPLVTEFGYLSYNLTDWPMGESVINSELIFNSDSLRWSNNTTGLRVNLYQLSAVRQSSIRVLIDTLAVRRHPAGIWQRLDVRRPVVSALRHGHEAIRFQLELTDLNGRQLRSHPDWSEPPALILYGSDRETPNAGGRVKRAKKSRKHRQHRTQPSRSGLCQRHSLYIDFKELNWQDWILAPRGYHAYFCAGNCLWPLTDSQNSTNHAVVQSIINSVNRDAVPKPSCIPTELSSISMLYTNNENQVVIKNYPDMIVESCGCR